MRTVRTECLDSILIHNTRHLHRVRTIYPHHYNTARPHRSLDLRHRSRFHPSLQVATCRRRAIECVDVLGGLIHEFRRAA